MEVQRLYKQNVHILRRDGSHWYGRTLVVMALSRDEAVRKMVGWVSGMNYWEEQAEPLRALVGAGWQGHGAARGNRGLQHVRRRGRGLRGPPAGRPGAPPAGLRGENDGIRAPSRRR